MPAESGNPEDTEGHGGFSQQDEPMKIARITICCCWLLFSMLTGSGQAQKGDGQGAPESPSDFVRHFYAWYVPRTLSQHSVPAYEFTLRTKKGLFTPSLFSALKEDLDAAAKVSDEIVGLDFDPFLNTQDPCKRYEVGKTIQRGDAYWVEVYGICSGKKSEKPDVWPEVVRVDGHWLFGNFHYEHQAGEYPDSADLLGILKILREDREKPHK